MAPKKGFKRGHYKRKEHTEDLEVPSNKNALEAKLNQLRGRIRMFQATMRGVKYRLKKGLDVRLLDEYQKLNQGLYRAKKAENALTYQKNML